MDTTQLSVNPKQLVNHLRFSFTQSTTVLGELMQNARRAGASFVCFEYAQDTQTLTVSDDGCGIACLNTLLTVAESGWEVEVIEREHPFGLGFLSAIFACEVISVDSKGGRFSANSAELLDFQPVTVETTHWNGITRLTLSQFKPEAEQIESELRRLARGFPIEVRFNGVSLERPRAVTSALSFVKTELGDLYLKGLSEGEDWLRQSEDFHLYLQGLPVYHSYHERNAGHVIHLDATRFFARLPDRDQLIDEAQVIAAVKRVVQREARQRLEAIKCACTAEAFVQGYDTLKAYRCLDLLNDVPLLPHQVSAMIEDYPVKEGFSNTNGVMDNTCVSRADVESGRVKLADLEDFDTAGALRWMLAWHLDYRVYRPGLDRGHWLFPYLIDLNTPAITLEVIGEKHSADFEGQWVSGQAVFCEQYRLSLGAVSIEIDNDAVYDEALNRFIVPRLEHSGMVVAQASSYHDEWDTYMESAKETDEWDFQNFVIANTANTPAEALRRLLPKLNNCPPLFSKAFKLELDAQGNVVGVEDMANTNPQSPERTNEMTH